MLTRREMLALAAAGRLHAGANDNAAELWNYFDRDLTAHDERRRRRLSEVHTPQDLAALQEHARRTLIEGIGGFPARSPLDPRHVGKSFAPIT